MAYYCNNKKCTKHMVKEAKVRFVMEESGLVSRCKECNEVKVSDSGPKEFGVPMISEISLMTQAQKKQMLLKRSDKDFKKNGENYDRFVKEHEGRGIKVR